MQKNYFKHKTNLMGKTILTSGLLITYLLIVACTKNQNHKNRFINMPTTIPEMMAAKATGTLLAQDGSSTKNQFPQNITLNSTIDGKKYKLKTNDSAITELYVDNVEVAPEKIADYRQITDQMIEDFWTKVALINATSKKINEEVILSKNSIEQQKKHVQSEADSIKRVEQKKR